MNFLLSCFWLIFVAIFIPVDLPAGGVSFCKDQIPQSKSDGIFFAGYSCNLHSTPSLRDPLISTITVGTPLKIIRSWESPFSNKWLQIEILGLQLTNEPGKARKGWVNV